MPIRFFKTDCFENINSLTLTVIYAGMAPNISKIISLFLSYLKSNADTTTTPLIIIGPAIRFEFLDLTKFARAMAIRRMSKQGFVICP